MKKIVPFLVLITLFIFALTVYFIDSFSFNFEINRTKASLYYSIQNTAKPKYDSLKITETQTEPYNYINQQTVHFKKKTNINWTLNAVNDSITKIRIDYTVVDLSYVEKLKLMFNQSEIKDFYKKRAFSFFDQASSYKQNYRLVNFKNEQSPLIKGYALVLKSKREDKAVTMMKNIAVLDAFFLANKLKIEGKPFVKITNWNSKTDSISFEFGFPSNATLSGNKEIKKIEYIPFHASSIEYYGNYGVSDQAWFYLYQKNPTKNFPLEIFYNNPQNGGDDKKWKALVYLQR